MTIDWYLSLDGDDVGQAFERYIVTNDPKGLAQFSRLFDRIISNFRDTVLEIRGTRFLLSGGDSLLVGAPESSCELLLNLAKELASGPVVTFSGGYGKTMRDSYIALKLAKASGKSCIVGFEEAAKLARFY